MGIGGSEKFSLELSCRTPVSERTKHLKSFRFPADDAFRVSSVEINRDSPANGRDSISFPFGFRMVWPRFPATAFSPRSHADVRALSKLESPTRLRNALFCSIGARKAFLPALNQQTTQNHVVASKSVCKPHFSRISQNFLEFFARQGGGQTEEPKKGPVHRPPSWTADLPQSEREFAMALLALALIFLIAGEGEFYLARKGSENLTACENRNLCSREHDHPPVCRDAAARPPRAREFSGLRDCGRILR